MSQPLPIDPLRPRFLDLLQERHLVVQADTGSGKSTRLPLWCREQGRVLVVEPRRVACLALASYLAEQDGSPLGETIGYAIRFDSCYRETSEVVFATPGIALRWLADDGLAAFDLVVIDEFHERRWDTDLLLALLVKAPRQRLVITSATLDAARLGDFLEGAVLQAEGRSFPVSVEHRAQDVRQMPELQDLARRVQATVERALPETGGDLLVFLPGRGEIQQCQQALRGVAADVIPLHGSVPANEQRRALETGSRRRIILATNIAETSLTIPGVRVVIDSGLERRTHQRNGRTVLGLHPISRASAEQRRGRAGRVAPGHCIRLYGEHAPLELTTPPELLREELTEPVLAAACCGHPVRTLAFPDPLPEKSLLIAEEKLQRMAALDRDGLATAHGQRLYPLPIDSLFAHLISAMPDAGLRGATVDLVAALSLSQSLFRLPDGEQARRALAEWLPDACDASTLIALVRSAPPAELNIDAGLLREARTLANQLRRTLDLPALTTEAGTPQLDVDRARWLSALIQAAPELAFVRRQKRREALGNGYAEVLVGRHSRLAEDAEAALVLDQHSLPGKGVRQTLTIATCLAPVTFRQLAREQLGELHLAGCQWQEGELAVEVERHYAGRVINREASAPQGALAREALARLILEQRLLVPAGERLQDDLAAWALYRALNAGSDEGEALGIDLSVEPPDAQVWLEYRLDQLGVEQAEDIELIEPEDLRFAGVPDWQREHFDATWPRRLSLGDLLLAVHYEPERKRVTVEPLQGTRKTPPKRWELPRWNGWPVRYRKASRVIDIT